VMAAREGRPLLMVDLAVPRDIAPECREVAGVSVHDVDDVQAIAERNASGRAAEGRRAERLVDAELARFQGWIGSLEVVPTVAAMRRRADEIVERVLAENEQRWENLTDADRERVHALANAIASRMLHEPTLRLKRSSGDDESYLYVSALRALFGLDSGTEPLAADDAEVTELDSRRKRR
jgi:glutamyl-tRNA reductase